MIEESETFGGTWPYKARYTSAAGFRQHYVDEGPADGEVVICLHGEPTWGYIYRKFIPFLSQHYRVIVPDHMGFGKSETPQDREYTLKTHTENLAALIKDLDLKNITFVVQDWGGLMAGAYSIRNPSNVSRICLMNTLFGYGSGQVVEEPSQWFAWIAKHYEAGTLNGLLGELGSCVLSVMKITGFQNSAAVDDNWIRAYSAPFPDRTSCKGAIEFPLDFHLGRAFPYLLEGVEVGDLEALKRKPAMLAVGMQDRAIHPENIIADFKGIFPNGPISYLPNAGHYCQEDDPETLVALIHQFIQMN
jgi:haloalkane dehalogenase